ncbi:MAG: hypothetical protein MUE49_13975 [Rhodospirillales bacterium]|nr:hypothetical protein [Rhodospirillales bacterium]
MTELSRELPAIDPAGFDRPTATASALAVAGWLLARAEAEGLTLQPLKVQALMFLAQGAFSARTGGRLLMPAMFVADERAPVEPNVLAVLASGYDPRIGGEGTLTSAVERFLDLIWERFGRRPTAELVTLVNRSDAYAAALACGTGTPMGNDAIRRSCAGLEGVRNDDPAPAAKPLRTQDGRMVTVSAWHPAGPCAADSEVRPRRPNR